MRWSLYLHLQTKWHKNTSTGISRQKIAAGLREASCQSWEWFEIYPTADRPASRPTTDRHRLSWLRRWGLGQRWSLHWYLVFILVFALASGVSIGLSSLHWQVVAGPSMVEWKSGQVDGATRHKGDPTPVHNLHITSSSIWQLAKTQNKKEDRKHFLQFVLKQMKPNTPAIYLFLSSISHFKGTKVGNWRRQGDATHHDLSQLFETKLPSFAATRPSPSAQSSALSSPSSSSVQKPGWGKKEKSNFRVQGMPFQQLYWY